MLDVILDARLLRCGEGFLGDRGGLLSHQGGNLIVVAVVARSSLGVGGASPRGLAFVSRRDQQRPPQAKSTLGAVNRSPQRRLTAGESPPVPTQHVERRRGFRTQHTLAKEGPPITIYQIRPIGRTRSRRLHFRRSAWYPSGAANGSKTTRVTLILSTLFLDVAYCRRSHNADPGGPLNTRRRDRLEAMVPGPGLP